MKSNCNHEMAYKVIVNDTEKKEISRGRIHVDLARELMFVDKV